MRFFADVNQIDIGNMKKVVLGLFMTLGMVSGGVQAQEVKLMSDADTLSYMLGVTNSDGLKDYAMKRMGIDEEYVTDFIRVFKKESESQRRRNWRILQGFKLANRRVEICSNVSADNCLKVKHWTKSFSWLDSWRR